MKHFSSLFLFCFVLHLSVYAQFVPGVEWEQCLPNTSVRSAIAISNSIFTIAYDLKSCTDSSAVGLRSYNSDDSLLWEKIITPPPSKSYRVFSLSKTSNHGYIFSGSKDSSASNFNWLVKTDSTGNILWEKQFFFSDTAKTFYGKTISIDDGNYLMVADGYSASRRDVMVMKLNSNGDILWQKLFGDTLFDYARDVVSSDDGGFLIAAYTSSTGGDVSGNHGANDIWLLKIKGSGELQWQKCYGGTMNEESRSVIKLTDGYLICGMSQSKDGDVTGHHDSTAYYDDWVFRIDESGNLIWEKSFGGDNHDYASQMIPLSDGNFLFTGSSYSTNGNITDHHSNSIYDDQWTFKITGAGNLVWAKSTGGSGDDWSNCIAALDSVNYIIAGASIADDGDHQNACFANDCHVIEGGWIVKLNGFCSSYPTSLFSFSQNGKALSFTNQSLNAQTYLWDFGDGNFSSDQNPTHTYTFNGEYTVCLTAFDSCTSQTYCATISTCTGVPNSLFIFSYPGGTDVQFTDLSSNAAKWNWDFGDGDTDITQNPLHLYSQNGTYTVVLTVMDSCGQSDVSSQTINTCNGFHVDFSYTANANTISFTDLSVGLPNSWSWNFGDGGTSLSQNPAHTYTAGGTYNVCLTVTTDGCSSQSVCKMISVCNPVELDSFTYNDEANHISFFDASQNATEWTWDFGDGNFSSQQNPEHTFAQAGIYTVCEVVSNSCNSDTSCEDLSVECPSFTAGFTFVQSNDTVSFIDQSLSAVEWHWDFGDGAISAAQNPSHVYTDAGTFNVCLISSDSCSSDTFCDIIHIIPVGINEPIISAEQLKVYPNPATGQVSIAFTLANSASVTIMLEDVDGKMEKRIGGEIFSAGMHTLRLDIHSLSSGIYLIRKIDTKGVVVKKLIVQ